MHHSILLFLLLLPTIFSGQSLVRGTVIDGADRSPLPFATVYFDGTTRGQTTDEDGAFRLPLTDITLPAVLVVSHVGYQPLSFTIEQVPDKAFELQLQPVSQTISTVVVQDRNQRAKNLEEFRRLFLGTDAWAQRTRIQNEEALLFSRDYETRQVTIHSDRIKHRLLTDSPHQLQWAPDSSYVTYETARNLKASTNGPIQIDLPNLGYTLQLDLVHFESDYQQNRTGYLGYYFYQPYEQVRRRHKRNRERAYFHSRQHFLRSLHADSLAENGYQLLEKVGEALEDFDISPFLHPGTEQEVAVRGLRGRTFIILYYGNAKGRPKPPRKWRSSNPIQSGVHFRSDEYLIRPDGTMGEQPLLFSGHLGTRGIAWALPGDY